MIPFLILFFIGSLIIPAGDMVHVLTSTTAYPQEQLQHTLFGVIPWWVPFLFGFGGVGAGIHTIIVRKKFKRERSASVAGFIGATIAFLGMYFLSGLLPKNVLNDAVLACCGLGLFFSVGDRTIGGLLQIFGVVLGGTAAEIILVQNGIFSYNEQRNQLFGVAPWLPWLYVGVAIAVDNFLKWWGSKKPTVS